MKFNVTLAAHEGVETPAWVFEDLAHEGIELLVHNCETRQELVQYAGSADLIWVRSGSHIVTADALTDLPRCQAILRTGAGTDNVPVAEATRRGIVVANTPEATTDQVADHSIGLLLSVIRQIPRQDRNIRAGIWDRYQGWPDWHLNGQTLGFIGFGKVARMVCRKISGFKPLILAYDPYLTAETIAGEGGRAVGLEELLGQSDFVSIHCALQENTRHLIGERELRLMKPRAILINTSRGQVIDEKALIRALREGWIAAAGLDVFEEEPIGVVHPLLELNNVVVTPHMGAFSDQFDDKFWRYSLETIIDIAGGRWPRSVVNPAVKPMRPLARAAHPPAEAVNLLSAETASCSS